MATTLPHAAQGGPNRNRVRLTPGETERLPFAGLTAVALLAALVVCGVRFAGWLEPAELAAFDLAVRWRAGDLSQPSDVVVIGFNDDDLERWNWPVPDEILSKVIKGALSQGASVVGVDIYRDAAVEPGHDDFTRTLRDNETVVAVMKYPSETSDGVPPPPVVQGKSKTRVGFSDMVVDSDGSVRRGLLYLAGKGSVEKSLSLQTARLQLKRRNIAPQAAGANDKALKLGASVIRPLGSQFGGYRNLDAAGYQFLLDFRREPSQIPVLSSRDVLEKKVDRRLLSGKIALIGIMSEQVKDLFILPVRGAKDHRATFGVILHAMVVDQILRLAGGVNRPTRSLNAWWENVLIVLGAVLIVLAGWRSKKPLTHMIVGAVGVCLVLAGGYFGLLFDWWLPAVPVALAGAVAAVTAFSWRVLRERRERLALAQLLNNQVSPQVAQELWDNRRTILEGVRPRPTRLTATVLFIDLVGSTTVADQLEPDQLVTWLSEFLGEMADAVAENHGVVEKFTGDGLMAIFGVPVPRTEHSEIEQDARNAVECALQMGRRLKRLNGRIDRSVLPEMRCRIGIHTGRLSAGSVGTRSRMQYSVIGQTANLASRIEGLGKDDPKFSSDSDGRELSCRILLSEATVELLPAEYNVQSMGKLELRGAQDPMEIYRLSVSAG